MSSKITQYEKDAKALPDSAIYEQTVNERFFQIFIKKSKKCEKMKIIFKKRAKYLDVRIRIKNLQKTY